MLSRQGRVWALVAPALLAAALLAAGLLVPAATKETARAPSILLNDGRLIPRLGLGVFRVPPGNATYDAVRSALAMGYRHIDTAQGYFNEAAVGRAVKDSGIPRSDLWVTTKLSSVWYGSVTYEQALTTLKESLNKLDMDYVDLYLIHSPRDKKNRNDQWRALVKARELGLAKSIGVSDFEKAQLVELEQSGVMPAVLQVEISPWLIQHRAAEVQYCKEKGIVIEAWGALAVGRKFDEPELRQVQAAHPGRSVPEILERWCLQMGLLPLLTSQNPAHQRSNLAVAEDDSWLLTDEDFATLAPLASRPYFSVGKDISGEVAPFG